MHKERLEDMVKGWFVGNFEPTMLKTNAVEVAVKHYQAGDHEDWHYHKIATELTVIVSGEVRMNGVTYIAGDIIQIDPNEGTDFTAVTATTTVAVKIPGANNDKYLKGQ